MKDEDAEKIKINKDWFIKVLKERGFSIRKLGEAYDDIERTEKTIRTHINNGEMSSDLLERIAKYLNVHPDYLAGKYAEKVDRIKEPALKRIAESHFRAENYPYFLKVHSDIDYHRFFEDILTENKITMEQFETLEADERVLFRQEMAVAIYRVIAKYFPVDSLGNNTGEELSYIESFASDVDPFSYFAELEGIGLTEEDLPPEEIPEESDEERRLRAKYFPDDE